MPISLFVQVLFNEMWLLSSIFYCVCFGFYMYKTGYEILGQLFVECAIRTAFCTILYAITAYRVEGLTK